MLGLHHIRTSHGGDKGSKNSLLINGRNNHNLSKDFYLFNIGISLLRAVYFDDYFNDFIGNIGTNLWYFGIIFIIFDQFGRSIAYLTGLADGWIGVDDKLFCLESLDTLY